MKDRNTNLNLEPEIKRKSDKVSYVLIVFAFFIESGKWDQDIESFPQDCMSEIWVPRWKVYENL